MDFIQEYIHKQNFTPEIEDRPNPNLRIIIVIPCFNEPDLISSLKSIYNCSRPSCATEVIIVINSPENCSAEIIRQNLQTKEEALEWIQAHDHPLLMFHLLDHPDLPKKFAGVGLARKIGMDEAAFRLNLAGNPKGIIAGFDADSACDPNYLSELVKHFNAQPKTPAASIYFEHPAVNTGIILYELHLRYLNQALRYAGHPYAFHTVGSSFAVRCEAYVKQGGMNRKQAGEDFYFLQKIISLGKFTEINTTRIIPSARESGRVPFGTGASMNKWKSEGQIKTYHLKSFEKLKIFIDYIPDLYQADTSKIISILDHLDPGLRNFLLANKFTDALKIVRENSASRPTFINRFFHWFNAFRVIKYLNYAENLYENDAEICTEAAILAWKEGFQKTDGTELLEIYRKLDRAGFGINPPQ